MPCSVPALPCTEPCADAAVEAHGLRRQRRVGRDVADLQDAPRGVEERRVDEERREQRRDHERDHQAYRTSAHGLEDTHGPAPRR